MRREAFLAGAALAVLSAFPALADPTYRVTDLGSIAGGGSFGYGISASGTVTGYSYTNDGGYHAFLYDGSTMRDLGALPGAKYSTGFAVNASGQVAGESNYVNGYNTHAFLYDGATMKDLGTLPGGSSSHGRGINAAGQVAGYSYVNGFSHQHAFLYSGGAMKDLGTLVGDAHNSEAFGINAGGEVTGWSDAVLGYQPFLYNGSTMKGLGTLGGLYGQGYGINASGEVTGWSTTVGGDTHAFLYGGSGMADLGTLGGSSSQGRGINASGEVVGYSATSGGSTDAFLFDGTMLDINDLIAASDPLFGDVRFIYGEGINDSGQISAYGCYTGGQLAGYCRAFRLDPAASTTPVSEPATLALLSAAVAGLGLLRCSKVR